jgi:hypothetical protein
MHQRHDVVQRYVLLKHRVRVAASHNRVQLELRPG